MSPAQESDVGIRKAERIVGEAIETRAKKMSLKDLGLNELPGSIDRLTQLQELDIGGNRLAALPESIGRLTQLQRLNLWGNRLTGLPESFGQLTLLRELDLSHNRVATLPKSFAQLTQLQQIDLYSNHLAVLPESLTELVQLRWLGLSHNRLEALPESIGRLTQLQDLHLHGNLLTDLPESFVQLTQIRSLSLHGNQVRTVPESVCQSGNLRCLVLSGNVLAELPESLGQLTHLKELYLRDNKLESLPESIGQLQQIEKLDLSNNLLTLLPATIGQLSTLQEIHLGGNRIMHLPTTINRLAQIRVLDLSGNKLTLLPESIRDLTALEQIRLHGNDSLCLPPEVMEGEPAGIFDYYFRMIRGARPLNEAKLIVVGRGGVGKTSLVNRLLSGCFNKDEKNTEGITISKWNLSLCSREQGNQGEPQDVHVRLNVWDFGGQDIMHATHQFFLTQRSLYLLVLEGRQGTEDADAEYWLKLIQGFGAETSGEMSPVLVVLNKTKMLSFDLNRPELQRKYPFIRGFISTDCEDATGIELLRAAIERETDGLKHLRDSFPMTWFAIKDYLAGMKENLQRTFITFGEYRSICAQHGETDAAAQDSLATHLHNLGVVLNYNLRDMYILDPLWVTNGIYKILNSPQLKRQKGVLGIENVEKILDRSEYPREIHYFLLDLMRKFEICFAFPDRTHHLIPELLDKQEAEVAAEFDPANCLSFEYHYPVLPEGLLPRFIVRTHNLSAAHPEWRWRTGVVIASEKNRALVKVASHERCVTIAIDGPASGRRDLLARVRGEFDVIHGAFKGLQPREYVGLPGYPTASPLPYDYLLAKEACGEREGEVFVDSQLVKFTVRRLLDDIESQEDRAKRWQGEPPIKRTEIVIQHVNHLHIEGNNMGTIDRGTSTQNFFGGSFSECAIANRQTLQHCLNTIQQTEDPALRANLEELRIQVDRLLEMLDKNQETERAAETRQNLEILVKESVKIGPRREWFDFSSDGLIEAAKTVQGILAPIISIVGELRKLLFG